MKIEYLIYNPAGNITALVKGDKFDKNQKKIINDEIMRINPQVEQVGFLSLEERKITMAGDEFCGNATRCATLYYLNDNNEINIQINRDILKAGRDIDNKIWCEIPIYECKIEKLNEKIYKVKLSGITIVPKEMSEITVAEEMLKEEAKNIIKSYNIDDDAVGIIFYKNDLIYPVVWVKAIDTLFLENSCGSGTIGLSILKSVLSNESKEYRIKQPSGQILETEIKFENGKIISAILKGEIIADNIKREIEI